MTAPTLSRRPSLWADEPVMRDGAVMNAWVKAAQRAAQVQDSLLDALQSSKPDAWLADVERDAIELLEHIRSMRAELVRSAA